MNNSLEWVYGIHACQALIEKHPERIITAYSLAARKDEKLQNILASITQLGIKHTEESREALDKRTDSEQHQGIAFQCKASQTLDKSYLKKLLKNAESPLFFLLLDGITDPHNLGACIRSAEAAGVDALIIPKNKAASLSPVTRKVACGAAEILPIISVTNLAQCLEELKSAGVWLYGAAGEATASIYQTDLTGNIGIVLGSEGEGLRHLTRERCDALMKIPMLGHTNSLNVSVATGICLFEATRQRQTS